MDWSCIVAHGLYAIEKEIVVDAEADKLSLKFETSSFTFTTVHMRGFWW
jgi:hypothetical protein